MDQVEELNISQGFLLLYAFFKEREVNIHNKATIPSNMPNPQGEDVSNCGMNTCEPQGLESSSISYRDKQLAEPNSWNGKALPLSLFGTIEFLEIDSKNISTLLLCMADFI